MAGGHFDKLVGKVRPGTYINFESGRENNAVSTATRGTVIIPLANTNYGPSKQFIKLTSASPDAAAAMFGYSIYDSDPNRQMLLIREAFKRASTVYAYILTEGEKAQAEITMALHSASGLAVHAEIGEGEVDFEDDPPAVPDLPTTNKLTATAKYGGTDAQASNLDITDFIDAWESVKFNTVCFPFNGENSQNIKQAALTKIRYMRDNMGKGVQVVIPDAGNTDYEGVINVTNSVFLGDEQLSRAEVCAWVAGAAAGATNTESLTYHQYAGATVVADPKSNEQAIAAINAGEFFFSVNENDEIVVEYDINSLITFTDGKDQSYRKNRVIRVFDTFQEAVQLNFPPNKFNNSATGWDIMEGIGKTILKQFEDAGAIANVSYDEDFLVDRESSADDETYFNIGLQAVDSAEKLYFTIKTR